MVRDPMRMNGVDARYAVPPRLGEHSRSILSTELGVSDSDLDRLVAEGVVVTG
jgi:crotonobetainyl-CoA:carnitine CoA-transferase CaiB-like acyl-CoA transferase